MSNNNEGSFSPLVAFCFTLNIIIGTGIVTLPWAFLQGGTALSTICMALSCFLSSVSCDYLITSIARAQRFVQWQKQQQQQQQQQNQEDKEVFESSPLMLEEAATAKETQPTLPLVVQQGRFDLPDMCHLFLGQIGRISYFVCVSTFLFGVLWAYSSVFGRAMAQEIPIQNVDDSYQFWVLVFAAVVVPASCLELSEQVWMQITISTCRLMSILFMVITPLVARYTHSTHFADQSNAVGAPLFDFSGLHRMFPIVGYAIMFHYSTPTLTADIQDKTQLSNIFTSTLVFVGLAYTFIGTVNSSYFGNLIEESSNINWGVYHGGTGRIVVNEQTGELERVDVALWATIISVAVVCFPAVDVISAFPLDAIVLGNSLRDVLFVRDRMEIVDRRITTFFRCLATIPPIVASLYARNLGKITDFTGLSGIAILYIFPPLLFMYGRTKLHEHGLEANTINNLDHLPLLLSFWQRGCWLLE